ncbi:Hypothetical predicted protein [Olea europaea subsp. europaea]|uniref:Uncharacterized protein n=1 Tax=Olea europaea subsp. europaea TaxID=158383 RepID=A0A8S0UVZ4_OLEEU|nr:Hypothetical predicted protein [Olea europaea subsp. europaea]
MNMEIPDMKLISDFECLQNPTLISRLFSLSGPRVFSFWKWGAVIFLLFATLRSLIKRIKLIFVHFCSLIKPSPHPFSEDFEFSEGDDCSSISSEEEEEKNIQTTSISGQRKIDGDFCVKGRQIGNLRQRTRRSSGDERFAWSEFTCGKHVVKLWDSLDFGLNLAEDNDNNNCKSVVSLWDFDHEEKKGNSFGRRWNIPALAMESPEVVLTAEGNEKRDDVVLGGYDKRMPRGIPAIYAEWGPTNSTAAAAAAVSTGGVEKVYVRNGVTGGLTVGDIRKLKTPIENVTESGGETWWEADAVIV